MEKRSGTGPEKAVKRLPKVYASQEPSMTKPQPDSRERLAEAISQEQRDLQWCLKHDLVVWWDGPGNACPVCGMQNEQREEAAKEFLEMTKEMEDN
jgi:hypothetical protein